MPYSHNVLERDDNKLLAKAYTKILLKESIEPVSFSPITNEICDYIIDKLSKVYIKSSQGVSPEESIKYNKAVEEVVIYLSEYLQSITDEKVIYSKQ